MKLLILTTDPTLTSWKTYRAKLEAIQNALRSGHNAEWDDIEVKYVDVTPVITGQWIDSNWLRAFKAPYFKQGYDLIGLHSSLEQWKDWGVKPTLRGANPNRGTDELEDFYFSANERSLRHGLNRFIQVCLHEICHGYYDHSGETDVTHAWHEANPDITGLLATFDWGKYQPERMALKRKLRALQFFFIKQLRSVLAKPLPPAPLHPVAGFPISQAYGTPNKAWYPLTGHHLGADYATPRATHVLAPLDGVVTQSGFSASTGHFAVFTFMSKGVQYAMRIMHLKYAPGLFSYRRGEVIAETGNTGMSTGAHVHLEIWRDEVRIDTLTKSNWRDKTLDPESFFGGAA